MSRLQDFPTVTPTSSDNLLVVQSQGQGLASVGSTLGAKMDKANPTGTGALSINRKANTTVGTYSTTEGSNCEASGSYAHAEGYLTEAKLQATHTEGRETTANGNYAHAEGRETQAIHNQAHAEGYQTTASGNSSHAEGYQTTSSGLASHAEGYGTIANHKGQHVYGEYNLADASTAMVGNRGNYVEIVGKGTNDENRSNARTLDWNGNETIAGTLTQSSDARLKDVKTDTIPDVSSIKAVRFTWRKGIGRDFDEHIGYLAQDVEKALPFLVKEDAEGNKVLDYIAFLVAKVDSLEKRISELEKGE